MNMALVPCGHATAAATSRGLAIDSAAPCKQLEAASSSGNEHLQVLWPPSASSRAVVGNVGENSQSYVPQQDYPQPVELATLLEGCTYATLDHPARLQTRDHIHASSMHCRLRHSQESTSQQAGCLWTCSDSLPCGDLAAYVSPVKQRTEVHMKIHGLEPEQLPNRGPCLHQLAHHLVHRWCAGLGSLAAVSVRAGCVELTLEYIATGDEEASSDTSQAAAPEQPPNSTWQAAPPATYGVSSDVPNQLVNNPMQAVATGAQQPHVRRGQRQQLDILAGRANQQVDQPRITEGVQGTTSGGYGVIVHGIPDAQGQDGGKDTSAELVSQLLREFQGAPWSRWLADAEAGLPSGSSVEIQVEHEGRVYVCEVSLPGLLRHTQQQANSTPTVGSSSPCEAPTTPPPSPPPLPRPPLPLSAPPEAPALQPYMLSSAVVVSAVCPCALVCLPSQRDGLSVPWSVQPSAPVHVLMRLATRRSALRSIPALQSTQGVRFLARGQGQDVPVRLQLLPAGSQETPLLWRQQQQETAALLLAQHTKPASLPGRGSNRGAYPVSQTAAANTAANLRARRIVALTSALNTGVASQAWRTVDGALGPAQPLDDIVYTLWCLSLDVSTLRPPCSLVLEVKAGTVLLDTQPLVLLEPSTASLAPELHELVTSSPMVPLTSTTSPSPPGGNSQDRANSKTATAPSKAANGRLVRAKTTTTSSSIAPVTGQQGKDTSSRQDLADVAGATPQQGLRAHSWPAARHAATPLASTISLGRQVQSQRLAAAARAKHLPPVPMYGPEACAADDIDWHTHSMKQPSLSQAPEAGSDQLLRDLQNTAASPPSVRTGAGCDTARALLKDLGTWFEYVSACNSSGVSDNPMLAGSTDSRFGFDRPQLNLTKSGSVEAARVLGSRLSTLSMAAAIKDRAFQRAAVRVGSTLLHYSVSAGWPETATRLLSTLLGPAGGCTFADIRYNHGTSLLHKALASGRAGMVRSVVSWGQQFGERWSWPDSIAQLQSCLAAGQELLSAPSAPGPMPSVPEAAAVMNGLWNQQRQHSNASTLFESAKDSLGLDNTEGSEVPAGKQQQQLQAQQADIRQLQQQLQDMQHACAQAPAGVDMHGPQSSGHEGASQQDVAAAQQEATAALQPQMPSSGQHTANSSMDTAVSADDGGEAADTHEHDEDGYYSCEELEAEQQQEGQPLARKELEAGGSSSRGGSSKRVDGPTARWIDPAANEQHMHPTDGSSMAGAQPASTDVVGMRERRIRGLPLPHLLHSAWFGFAQAPVESQYADSSVQWQLARVWSCMVMCMILLSVLRSGLFGKGFSELPALLVWLAPYPLLYVVATRQWTKMLPTALLACWTGRWVSLLSMGLDLVQCPEAVRMMMHTGVVYIADPFLYTLVERLSLPYLAVLHLPYALAYILVGHRLRIPYATACGLAMCIAGVCMGVAVDITSRWMFCIRHGLDGSGLPLGSSAAVSRHIIHSSAQAFSEATSPASRFVATDSKASLVRASMGVGNPINDAMAAQGSASKQPQIDCSSGVIAKATLADTAQAAAAAARGSGTLSSTCHTVSAPHASGETSATTVLNTVSASANSGCYPD